MGVVISTTFCDGQRNKKTRYELNQTRGHTQDLGIDSYIYGPRAGHILMTASLVRIRKARACNIESQRQSQKAKGSSDS
jgi:hypothetical protein